MKSPSNQVKYILFFMLRYFLFSVFLLKCFQGFTQFTKVYSCQLNHSWFGCDPYKNIYAVSESKFIKLSPPYTESQSYDLQKEGNPSFIDVNVPNEIVLYFEDYNKVILLDSSLNEIIRPFYLNELGMDEVSLIFATNDKGLWFYRNYNNSLTKLNKDFLPVIRSLSLNPWFQLPTEPNFVTSFENRIYVNVPSNGILVLGQNGEYRTAFQLPGLEDFQVSHDAIYFYRDNVIYCFNFKTLKTNKIYIPFETDILNAYFHDNQIIVLSRDGFSIYHHEIDPTENE